MSFVGQVLGNVSGIQWYSIVGLIIFITLFIVVIIRTIKTPKEDLMRYKQSILDNDPTAAKDNQR